MKPNQKQTEMPRAAAEEIAQKLVIKVLADEVSSLTRHYARILALRKEFGERGIPDADNYDGADHGADYERDGGRCPVCYKTGERILDWAVCREHAVRWAWRGKRYGFTWTVGNSSFKQEFVKLRSFREVSSFHEPLSLMAAFNAARGNADGDPLIRAIERELVEAVMENPPSDEAITVEWEKEKWLAIRREEALKIDAATAEVSWVHAQGFDPYGVEPELPPEYDCVGREYFARRPDGDIWVSFHDLPKTTVEALWGPQFKRWEEECLRRDGELPVLRF